MTDLALHAGPRESTPQPNDGRPAKFRPSFTIPVMSSSPDFKGLSGGGATSAATGAATSAATSVATGVTASAAVQAPAHHTALGATWAGLKHGAWRQVAVVSALCVGIAVLLALLDRGAFGTQLVYALCIGTICASIVAAVRLLVAAWIDRSQRRAGLALQLPAEAAGLRPALAGALLAMLIGPSLGMLLADWLTGLQSPSLMNFGSRQTQITVALSVAATVLSVAIIVAQERLSEARAQAEAAKRLAAENQLRLLQSQLEPHMLFNTLANLRVLVGIDAERAQTMLDHLIAFLRATLSASRTAAHPLSTEFERLTDYLALMAIRMGPRLQFELDLPPALRDLPIPPLLLQPLVENAIKHGLEPQVQGGQIRVQARLDEQMLTLTVCDTGVGLATTQSVPTPAGQGAAASTGARSPLEAAGSGFGIEQIRSRLATLHGDRASLTLAAAPDAAGGTLATLLLPVSAASATFTKNATPAKPPESAPTDAEA